jgi:regulator of protease activity HflC (stomatin/prohibitin superfamily)
MIIIFIYIYIYYNMERVFILFIMPALTCGFCLSGVNQCVNEQHIGVCFTDKYLEGVYPPGKIYINPMSTSCFNERVTSGGKVDEYRNQVVGVQDSKITFPLITVRYAICPRMQEDMDGCLTNVTKIMKKIGRNYEDVLIEEQLPNDLNSFMSSWSTEDAWSTRFSEIEDIIHTRLQKNIDEYMSVGMPLTITKVAIPSKPLLDDIQTKRFAARADTARIKEEALRDKQKSIAEHEKSTAKAESITSIEKHKQEAEHELALERLEHEKSVSREKQAIAKIEAETLLINTRAEAEANKLKLTPEYLEYERIKGLNKIDKVVYTGEANTLISDASSHKKGNIRIVPGI